MWFAWVAALSLLARLPRMRRRGSTGDADRRTMTRRPTASGARGAPRVVVIVAAALVRLVVRRAAPALPRRDVLLGLVASSRRRLLRSSADDRAAHPRRHGDRRVFGARRRRSRVRFFPVARRCRGVARRGGDRATTRRRRARRCIAAVSFALMPLAAAGLVLATPDAPLLAAERGRALLRRACAPVAAPLAGIAALVVRRRRRARTRVRVEVHVHLPPRRGHASPCVLRPSLRARLREPGPYVACVLADARVRSRAPLERAHDWISFRFQIQHGLGTPKGSALKRELELVGGQLGLVSPILFVLCRRRRVARAAPTRGRRALRARRRRRRRAGRSSSTARCSRAVEANWPAPSYVPARRAARRGRRSTESRATLAASRHRARRRARRACCTCYALVPILPLPARQDPHRARCRVGARSAAGGRGARAALTSGRAFVRRRPLSGRERARVSIFAIARRCSASASRADDNQYELWPGFATRGQAWRRARPRCSTSARRACCTRLPRCSRRTSPP